MIKAMHHTGFVVRDVEKSVEFYRDVVGLNLTHRIERTGSPISQVVGYDDTHLKIALLDTGDGHRLELIQYVNPPPAERPTQERSVLGATHLAFEVDDMDEAYGAATSGGAKSLNPPVKVDRVDPGTGKSLVCYLQDPDDNWIELVWVRD